MRLWLALLTFHSHIFSKLNAMRAKEIILNWELGYSDCLGHQLMVIINDLGSLFPYLKTEGSKIYISKVPLDLTKEAVLDYLETIGMQFFNNHFSTGMFPCLLLDVFLLLNFKLKVCVNWNRISWILNQKYNKMHFYTRVNNSILYSKWR